MGKSFEPVRGRAPTAREQSVSWVLHRWPLLSGCGTVASSALARVLVPPSSESVWGRVDGLPCLVPLDDLVGRSIFLVGDLDRKVTWALNRMVRAGDTVLDVGANLGLVTLQMAHRVGKVGRVLSFEPSPNVLPLLHATLSKNPDLPVELFECALGAEESRLSLTVPTGNAGRASLVDGWAKGTIFEVRVRPLSKVLAEKGIDCVDVMKVDVEGYEFEVLRGLFDDTAAPRPGMIIFEESSPVNSKAFSLLRETGYQIYGLPKRSFFKVSPIQYGAPNFQNCHDYIALDRNLPSERMNALGLRGSA